MSSVGPPGDGEGQRREAEADREQVPARPRLDEHHDGDDEGGEREDEQQGRVVEADVFGEKAHGPSVPAVVRFFFPGRPALLNQERSKHWREHRARTAALRTEAHLRAKGAPQRRIERCEVVSYPTYITKRSWPDTGAHAPATKAAIDGFVDARLLPADTHEVVTALHFLAPRLGERDGLVVEIHLLSP